MTGPLDSRFPQAASYGRQYVADESSTGSYAEFEVTKLVNASRRYQSDHFYAGQVRPTGLRIEKHAACRLEL